MSSNPVATPATGAVTPLRIKITGDQTPVPNPYTTINPDTEECNPNPIHVSRKVAGKNVDIHFIIAGGENSDWKWSTTPLPIVFHAPAGIFSGGENPGGSGKGPIKVRDLNEPENDTTYKYTATFINTKTQQVKVVDPEVVNEL